MSLYFPIFSSYILPPFLWDKFESMIDDDKIISVREIENEINTYGNVDRLIE